MKNIFCWIIYKKHFSSVLLFSTLVATMGGPFDSNVGLHIAWAVRFLCSCIVCGQSAMMDVPIGIFPIVCFHRHAINETKKMLWEEKQREKWRKLNSFINKTDRLTQFFSFKDIYSLRKKKHTKLNKKSIQWK